MVERKVSLLALKIGFLVVTLVWFLWSFRETFLSAINVNEYTYFSPSLFRTWTQITDYSGFVGLVSRTLTSLASVVAAAMFMARRLSLRTRTKAIRWLLFGESIYWLSLFLSGIMAFLPIPVGPGFPLGFPLEAGIPCLVESIAIPAALLMLTYQLKPGKSPKSAISWALIAGAVYIFCLWLNNACNWLYVAVYTAKGWAYVVSYPENLLSFVLTVVGMLVLAGYGVYVAKKSVDAVRLRPIGVIVAFVGLYYLWNYLTWIYFGRSQLWSDWFSLLLGHNMNLWLLSLPIVGTVLATSGHVWEKVEDLMSPMHNASNSPPETHLSNKYASVLLIVGQGLAIIFLAVFLGAYLGGLPGVTVYQMEPAFKMPLQVFGGLFLLFALGCLFSVVQTGRKQSANR